MRDAHDTSVTALPRLHSHDDDDDDDASERTAVERCQRIRKRTVRRGGSAWRAWTRRVAGILCLSGGGRGGGGGSSPRARSYDDEAAENATEKLEYKLIAGPRYDSGAVTTHYQLPAAPHITAVRRRSGRVRLVGGQKSGPGAQDEEEEDIGTMAPPDRSPTRRARRSLTGGAGEDSGWDTEGEEKEEERRKRGWGRDG